MFLLGLQKLGKGDWRGIARNFVVSRTPTQVASHAQKYFIRQTNSSRRKRRSSLFDIVPEMQMDHLPVLDEQLMLPSPPAEPENTSQHFEPECNIPLPPGPTFYPAFIPVPYPFWPTIAAPVSEEAVIEFPRVLKPTPVLPREHRSVDEVIGLSKLSIGDGMMGGRMEPSALSVKLMEASASRQSAFHVSRTVRGNSSPIHAL